MYARNSKAVQVLEPMSHKEVQTSIRKPKMHSFGVQVRTKSRRRTFATQTSMQRYMVLPNGHALVNETTQTEIAKREETAVRHVAPHQAPVHASDEEESESEKEETEDEESDDCERDPSWHPEEDSDSDSDSDDEECSNLEEVFTYDSLYKEPKYIVFESKLFELFKRCPKSECKGFCTIEKFRPKCFGSQVKVQATCKLCKFKNIWYSQPKMGRIFAGNLLTSAAVLYAGTSPTQVLKVLNHMNLATISCNTFHDHQKKYLQPAVVKVWKREREQRMVRLTTDNQAVSLGGDGRADSPGHCGKFGSYTLMDLSTGKVVDLELVQSNEVTSSNAMELEGLKRALTRVKDAGVQVGRMVTDRHASVAKYMREQHQDIDHRYDVWHISKGIQKKITAVSKLKGCEEAGLWKKSIVNHIYWSASSTPDGDHDVIQTKYKSILNHIQNVHTGHGHVLYNRCAHGELDRPRVWLKPDSKVFDKLSEVLLKTRMLNDIKKMSPLEQTSGLEAYHSVLLYFCPKMIGFKYQSMKCRLYLSALHWNENAGRAQATRIDGEQQYRLSYPKPKAGRVSVSRVLTAPTYGYVAQLMEVTTQIVEAGNKDLRKNIPELQAPLPLSAAFDHPDKPVAVAEANANRRYAGGKD